MCIAKVIVLYAIRRKTMLTEGEWPMWNLEKWSPQNKKFSVCFQKFPENRVP